LDIHGMYLSLGYLYKLIPFIFLSTYMYALIGKMNMMHGLSFNNVNFDPLR
jgi:hypothetical protein